MYRVLSSSVRPTSSSAASFALCSRNSPLAQSTARLITAHPFLGQSIEVPSARSMSSVEASAKPESAPAPADVTLQYIVVRRDLWTEKGWPLGSVIAQACHAATAALWMSREDPVTINYCAPENIDHMHKVVLEIKNEEDLRKLSEKLKESGVEHKLWIEQPEDFATAIACKPYPKSFIQPHLKKLKLCKF